MQATLTPDELQLVEKLREKYGGARSGGELACVQQEEGSCMSCVASSQTSHGPAAQRQHRESYNVEASVCPECQGTGTLVEIYNHRRLENYCKNCEGRGVRVFKNGVEIKSGPSAGDQATSGNAAGAAGVVALHNRNAARNAAGAEGKPGGSASDAEQSSSPAERMAALRDELRRLATKAAGYTQERMDALAVMQQPARGSDPAGRDAAARDLVAQLDLQLERLEVVRRKKQLVLDRLERAGGATLDDIIANEAPRV